MTRVTAVMAAFNAASTIEASIRSVWQQTLDGVELIVVDDGSTDETRAILNRIDVPELRVITQANRGPSAARNRAIAAARGEFIACIDADDLWRPDKLEHQYAALRSQPEATLAYGWTDFVDLDVVPGGSDERVTKSGDVYADLLRANFISCGSNAMIRRSALEQVGAFDESLIAIEDWELHIRLAAAGPFVCVPRVLVDYRRGPDSLSTKFDIMEASFVEAMKKIFSSAPPSLRHLEAESAATFYFYMAARASQSRLSVRQLAAFARFHARSFRYSPSTWFAALRAALPPKDLWHAARGALRGLRRRAPGRKGQG